MRHSHVKERLHDSTFELNLAPMLDMLVVLITVLLVSFTSIRLGVLDGLIPQPIANAVEEDRKKTERTFSVAVSVSPKSGFVVTVKENGKENKHTIANVDGKFDFTKLHNQLVQLKLQHTDTFRIELMPSEEATYNDIVQVMDRVRTTQATDPKIRVKDPKTGETAETNLLFPDVVFANVVEG
ncbi:MAG: biopolymer transporter ExbD [Bdellovibrionales bacterium]